MKQYLYNILEQFDVCGMTQKFNNKDQNKKLINNKRQNVIVKNFASSQQVGELLNYSKINRKHSEIRGQLNVPYNHSELTPQEYEDRCDVIKFLKGRNSIEGDDIKEIIHYALVANMIQEPNEAKEKIFFRRTYSDSDIQNPIEQNRKRTNSKDRYNSNM